MVKFVSIFVACLIVCTIAYHRTPENFLRAESGWYLFLSQSGPEVRHGFRKMLVTRSFNGHFTPLAFLAEFETARLVGTRAGVWRWRQIIALAGVGSVLALVVYRAGRALEASRWHAAFGAAGVTAVLILQPWMREFVAWPFMFLQLMWLMLSSAALLALLEAIRSPERARWPWFAAASAYGSMHALGLGLATVAATATALVGLILIRRRAGGANKSDTAAVAVLLILGVGHAILMLTLSPGAPKGGGALPHLSNFAANTFGFAAHFLRAALQGLATGVKHGIDPSLLRHEWAYGVAVAAAFGCAVGAAIHRCRRDPLPSEQARFVLRTFSAVSFGMLILLIAARQSHNPTPHGFADFISGSRYLIPGSFALTGLLAELVFALRSHTRVVQTALYGTLAATALAGQLEFGRGTYRRLAPESTISHSQAWREVVETARECTQAGLPVPVVPLGPLTREFRSWDLRLFQPLLRADLGLPPGTTLPLVPWEEFASGTPSDYKRAVPSLRRVRKLLGLKPE